MSPDEHVSYPTNGKLVSGYFVDSPRFELGVAMGKDFELWLPICVHESSHMDQCLERTALWKGRLIPGTSFEAMDIVDLWIDRKVMLSQPQLVDYIRRAQLVELDCECRTAKKIQAFKLPIDVKRYIKQANSYVFFYAMIREARRWYVPGRAPYQVEALWSKMPDHFLSYDEYECVPKEFVSLYQDILVS